MKTDVRCHRCPASITVDSRPLRARHDDRRPTIAEALRQRDWDCTSGTVSCKSHRHLTAMPRPEKRVSA